MSGSQGEKAGDFLPGCLEVSSSDPPGASLFLLNPVPSGE